MLFSMSDSRTTHGRSIVVIDDNPDDLLLIRHGLMKAGVAKSIVTFEQPAEALEYLSVCAQSPDTYRADMVVFCDLKMPGLDGFSVLERIRAHRGLRSLRLILISGCALECDVERARELRADGYLEKIPSPETLRACLDNPVFPATGPRPKLFESWEASRALSHPLANGRS